MKPTSRVGLFRFSATSTTSRSQASRRRTRADRHSSLFSDPQYFPYRLQLVDVLKDQADGGGGLARGQRVSRQLRLPYDANDPTPLIDGLRRNLGEVLDFVRAQNPGITLVWSICPISARRRISRRRIRIPSSGRESLRRPFRANQATRPRRRAGDRRRGRFRRTIAWWPAKPSGSRPVDLIPRGAKRTTIREYQFTRDGPCTRTPCLQARIIARRISLRASTKPMRPCYSRASRIGRSSHLGARPDAAVWDWAVAERPFGWNPADDTRNQDGCGPTCVEFVSILNPRATTLHRSPSVRPVLPSLVRLPASPRSVCAWWRSSPMWFDSICVLGRPASRRENQLQHCLARRGDEFRCRCERSVRASFAFGGLDAHRSHESALASSQSIRTARWHDVHAMGNSAAADPAALCRSIALFEAVKEFSRSPPFPGHPFVRHTDYIAATDPFLPGTGLTRSSTYTRDVYLNRCQGATNHHVGQLAALGVATRIRLREG